MARKAAAAAGVRRVALTHHDPSYNDHFVVALDYKMTGMDGLAVMKTLRAKPETQPLSVRMLAAMTDEPSTRNRVTG